MDCKSAYSERKKMCVHVRVRECVCKGMCTLVSGWDQQTVVGVAWKLGLQVKREVASVDEAWGSHSFSASLRRGGCG